jgi:hypothetical protein
MICLPYGPITRTPGTRFVVETKDSSKKSRLIPFEYAFTDRYQMEFGEEYIRFCRNGAQILDGVTPYEITTSFLEDELDTIQYDQVADTLYLTNPDHFPQKLIRKGHTEWSIGDMDIKDGPFLDENDTDTTITLTNSAKLTTVGAVITASHTRTGSSPNNAFDGIKTGFNGWDSDYAATEWIAIELADPAIITRFRIWPLVKISTESGVVVRVNLRHFSIEAYIDSAWTKLPITQWLNNCSQYNTDEAEAANFDAYDGDYDKHCEVVVANLNSVTKYRLVCDDCWGTRIGVKEIELYEDGNADKMTASEGIFNADHIGSIWKILHAREDNVLTHKFTADGSSDSISVPACTWKLTTHGAWIGELTLQRSYDDGATWEDRMIYFRETSSDSNIIDTGTETEKDALYRLTLSDRTSGSCRINLVAYDYYNEVIAKITGFTSETEVSIQILSGTAVAIATKKWSEGSWSDYRGYPRAVCLHGAVLYFAGTTHQPTTIWGSRTKDYESFDASKMDDTYSFSYTIAYSKNPILWLASNGKNLIAGTTGDVYPLSTGNTDDISPTNFPKVRDALHIGCADIRPTKAPETLLFVQNDGRRIRELVYSLEQEGMVAPNLNRLCEQITKTGIVATALQTYPETLNWCILGNGTIALMVYERNEQVVSWQTQDTDGLYESIIKTRGTEEDEITVIVNRTIGGQTKRYIEQFEVIDFGDDIEDAFFVHSGVTFDGGDSVNVTNISHANPCTVTVDEWPTPNGVDLKVGDKVKFAEVEGLINFNGQAYAVATINKAGLSFTLNVNSTVYPAYTGGGTIEVVTNTVTGLAHLNGESLSILADGVSQTPVVVAGGSIALSAYFNTVHAGLGYQWLFEPLPFEIIGGSTTQGIVKRVIKLLGRFYKTSFCNIGSSETNYDPVIIEYSTEDVYDKEIIFKGGFGKKPSIVIFGSTPTPATINCLVPTFEIGS